jgi:hypothetical protein
MIRLGAKSQAEIGELFNVDQSTISRMTKEPTEPPLKNVISVVPQIITDKGLTRPDCIWADGANRRN